jgi:hypothetical protein
MLQQRWKTALLIIKQKEKEQEIGGNQLMYFLVTFI